MVMIEKLKFGMMSPQLIKKMSVLKVTKSDVYDADAYPIEGGVMDPHMGVIDPGMRCKTCGGKSGECLGHFGYIELAKPVLNILYVKKVKDVLTFTCSECGALLIKTDEKGGKDKDYDFGNKLSKMQPLKTCPKCEKVQEKLRFERPLSFRRGKIALNAESIRAQLEKISDPAAKKLGVKGGRPEWMIITLLPVPSITTRPSITLMNGERSEDDLTHKLVDIVRLNQRLANNLSIGAPEFILEDLWELLQYHVVTLFNNEVSGIPPARHRSGRQLKTFSQRLKTKEGRFRNNLTGKRVNFSARTVISPDPNISINEVGVPEMIAKELTVPIRATSRNIKALKACVKRGPEEKDGANYVIRPDGLRKKISEENKKVILDEITEGYIIEKHISDGDVVLFNRQPSLHRMSIMAHRVRVMPHKTFRLNLCVCRPYNADFDGDEMNLHVPQTAEARAETEELMLVENQIRSPGYGSSIIGCVQDYISGAYILTKKDTKIPKEDAAQMMAGVGIYDSLDKKEYSGKELFSMILPKGLNLEYKARVCHGCKDCKKAECPHDCYVRIADGQLISGVIDKNSIASESGKVLNAIDMEFGHADARKFLERVTRLTEDYLMRRGFTISCGDEDISKKTRKDIEDVIQKHFRNIEGFTADYHKKKMQPLPGRTLEETLEDNILKETYDVAGEAQSIIEHDMKENDAIIMARTGARGSMQNLTYMAGLVGQATLRGMRIHRGFKGRTLSCFKRQELGPTSHGFIASSYKMGLTPTEFFFEAMKGREGLMDSSLKTRISGYMQRRLVNALQDLKITPDDRVRDAGNTIVQFVPGEDGIDPSKSDGGKLIDVK